MYINHSFLTHQNILKGKIITQTLQFKQPIVISQT